MRRGKPEKKASKSPRKPAKKPKARKKKPAAKRAQSRGVRKKVQVWISAETGEGRRFLLLKLIPKRGGFWQPVTGGVEEGEKPAVAAWRESNEETALPFASDPVPVGYDFRFKKKGATFHEVVFRREAIWERRDDLKLDPREHVEAEWVEADEAFSRLRFDSNRAGLRAAILSLSSD